MTLPIRRLWHIVDAKEQIVGRLASQIAPLLVGKHKPTYIPHLDCGDYVVIVNASQIRFTGDKQTDKIYYWHTGYPGGLKKRTTKETLQKCPEEVLRHAILGMLPKNKLTKYWEKRLRIFSGLQHLHQNKIGDKPFLIQAEKLSLNQEETS